MKYIISIIVFLISFSVSYAAINTVPWRYDTTNNVHYQYPNIDSMVGIGTTSPYAKLSVVGETVAEFFTATSTTATSTFSGPLMTYGLAQFGGPYDEDLINENYIATFMNDIDGYANIEIMNPSLGENASSDIVITNASSSSDGYYAAFSLGGPNYNDPAFGLLGTPNSASLFSTYPNNALQIAAIGANSYVQIIAGSTSTEPTRFTSTGAVGIGSTSPSARLVVTNPLSTRTVVFEDQANDLSPFQIDSTGFVTTGSNMTVNGSITATNDLLIAGGDIYQSAGDMRILSEDALYLISDRENNDLNTSAIYFASNVNANATPAPSTLLGVIRETVQFGFGTTTTNSTFTVVATSTSATTTVEFGDRYTSASKVCFNTKNTAGASISFYFVGTTLTVENNRCN